MKLIFKLFLFLFLVAAILYAALFIFVNAHGRSFAIESFKNKFGVTARIDRFTFDFPCRLHVYNFELDNVSFSELNIVPNIFKTIQTGHIALWSVDVAGLDIKLTADNKGINLGILGKELSAKEEALPQFSLIPGAFAAGDNPRRFSVDHFRVERGTIEVTNQAKGANEVYYLRDVSLDLKNFVYPELTKFYIKLSASFESGKTFTHDFVDIDGWVDYAGKDMDIEAKFKGIDYCFFSRYLSSSWQASRLGLKEAFLDLDITLKAKADDMAVSSTITVQKYSFVREENALDLSRMKTFKTILAVLTGPQGKPVYTFGFSTKMDSPQLDLKGMGRGLNGTVNVPWMVVDGVISGAVKVLSKGTGGAVTLTGDTVNAAADILKGVYKQVKGTHKKKHKDKAQLFQEEPLFVNANSANTNSTGVSAGVSIIIPPAASANIAVNDQAVVSNSNVSLVTYPSANTIAR